MAIPADEVAWNELQASIADEHASPQSITDPFRFPHSNLEAKHYYYGLGPILVARSGADKWKPPTSPDARKEFRMVPGNHPIRVAWNKLGPQLCDVLDSMGVKWNSMDLVRIGIVDEYAAPRPIPVVVWIRVRPNTVSGKDGLAAVMECKKVLVMNNIYNVRVEMVESVPWGTCGER
ncbi:hypothetical protein M413DRAFT_342997 [Hebeloma cylindrosporum]|uniref:Uncharacterized protein n=1 Tax=Hebeloma cylindrosporum TaxID=76867 RepID=A0A0C3CNY3_HEBCY|nr:hypothetical protein M413DRAFT_342997 [Hebeloma cylindrosporum h7]